MVVDICLAIQLTKRSRWLPAAAVSAGMLLLESLFVCVSSP